MERSGFRRRGPLPFGPPDGCVRSRQVWAVVFNQIFSRFFSYPPNCLTTHIRAKRLSLSFRSWNLSRSILLRPKGCAPCASWMFFIAGNRSTSGVTAVGAARQSLAGKSEFLAARTLMFHCGLNVRPQDVLRCLSIGSFLIHRWRLSRGAFRRRNRSHRPDQCHRRQGSTGISRLRAQLSLDGCARRACFFRSSRRRLGAARHNLVDGRRRSKIGHATFSLGRRIAGFDGRFIPFGKFPLEKQAN